VTRTVAGPPAVSPLSLHDALPILPGLSERGAKPTLLFTAFYLSWSLYPEMGHFVNTHYPSSFRVSHSATAMALTPPASFPAIMRSEEHTSELQSRFDLVCRLLLEK